MKKLVLFAVVAALSSVGHWPSGVMGVSSALATENTAAPKPMVSVLTLERRTIVESASFPGRVAPVRQVSIRPQVDGIITDVLFRPGSFVEKGQPLYQIDSARYEAELATARAEQERIQSNISFLEARMQRYQKLVRNGSVSQQDFEDVKTQLDEAKAELAVARAKVNTAQISLGHTRVVATITGQAGRTRVSDGALALANRDDNTLTVITQIDPMNIDLQLTTAQAIDLRTRFGVQAELPVTVTLGTGKTPYPHTGKVMFTEATTAPTTDSVFLRAEFANPDGVLMPGTYAKATIAYGERDVLLVPQRATTRQPDGSLTVWVVDAANVAQPRPIQAGSAWQDQWIVASGLEAGETVVMTGYQKIRPGVEVQTQPWSTGAELQNADAKSAGAEPTGAKPTGAKQE